MYEIKLTHYNFFNENVRLFDSKESRNSFFENLPGTQYSELSNFNVNNLTNTQQIFQFTNNNIGIILNYNYAVIKNEETAEIYFYKVNQSRQESGSRVKVDLELDVFQTYIFDIEILESFVEREHQDRWQKDGEKLTPVFNIETENLNYGKEYKKYSSNLYITDDNINFLYIVTTKQLGGTGSINWTTRDGDNQNGEIDINLFTYCIPYENMRNNSRVLQFKVNGQTGVNTFTAGNIENIIKYLRANENVICMFFSKIPPVDYKLEQYDVNPIYWNLIVEKDDIEFTTGIVIDPNSLETVKPSESLIQISYRKNIIGANISNISKAAQFEKTTKPNKDDSKNIQWETKLFTYPYNFSKIFYGGSELTLKNEFLLSDTELRAFQSISEEGGSALFIKNYKTTDYKTNETIITNQTPNFVTMTHNAWLQYITQNRSSRTMGLVSAGASFIFGSARAVASGSMDIASVAGVAGGAMGIANILAKEADIKTKPDDLKQFAGDLSLNLLTTDLFAKKTNYSLTEEFKQKLFNYFYHFGYLCNEFKIPQLKTRYYFNYIKTTEFNLKANLSQNILQKFRDIFNNGVRIWHTDDIDYSKENCEISLL